MKIDARILDKIFRMNKIEFEPKGVLAKRGRFFSEI